MNRFPVQVHAHREGHLSRWLWLVKWLLLIPHDVILIFLGIGFVVTTLVAYVAVLFTGRYPPAIFAFNVGVLRWSWRVGYYGCQALGTDRYPPFTLADVADYPARLHVDPPARLPRWLPLVAWLFAVPHLLLVAALTGRPPGRLIALTIGAAGQYELSSGTTQRVPAPAGQSFRLATAAGSGPTVLNWQATNGDFAVVLANADGTLSDPAHRQYGRQP